METVKIAFAAVDRKIEQNIPLPKESEDRGKNFIYWGDANDYPVFLHKLYLDCPILQTIINTTTDYIVGNGVSCTKMKYANRKNQTWDDLFLHLAADYLTFGIAYIQITLLDIRKNLRVLIVHTLRAAGSNRNAVLILFSKQSHRQNNSRNQKKDTNNPNYPK